MVIPGEDICGGAIGRTGLIAMVGEFAGVGCRDRCSSSSGIGLGMGRVMPLWFLELLEVGKCLSSTPSAPVAVDSELQLLGPMVDEFDPDDEMESAMEPDKDE